MADKEFTLRIITPERVFYEGIVDMVEFNTTEGQIGVLPGHIPLTVIVKPGILHITEKDGEKEAALHSGFAEILPEGVTAPRGWKSARRGRCLCPIPPPVPRTACPSAVPFCSAG